MEISSTQNVINTSISRPNAATESNINAYGIGTANQPKVELSPQARILQQNEQQQEKTFNPSTQPANDNAKESTQDFVRVSSSIGKGSQSNALTSDQALEVYRSIEKLL